MGTLIDVGRPHLLSDANLLEKLRAMGFIKPSPMLRLVLSILLTLIVALADATDAFRKGEVNPMERVTVALLDTGFDYYKALADDRLWINVAESADHAADGRDNDHNGYVDDWAGWDWASGDNDPFDWPLADTTEPTVGAPLSMTETMSHGTAMLDVLTRTLQGAPVSLQTLRVGGGVGPIAPAQVVAAIDYSAAQGARISVLSLALVDGRTDVEAILRAIERRANMLFIVAAGNSSNDLDQGYPSLCRQQPNLICVAATAGKGLLVTTNFGRESVDLATDGRDDKVAATPGIREVWTSTSGRVLGRGPRRSGLPFAPIVLAPRNGVPLSCVLAVMTRPAEGRQQGSVEVTDFDGKVLAEISSRATGRSGSPGVIGKSFLLPHRVLATVGLRDPNAVIEKASISCASERSSSVDDFAMSGTSIAASRVAGFVARIGADFPNLNGARLKDEVLNRTERMDALRSQVSGGRVLID